MNIDAISGRPARAVACLILLLSMFSVCIAKNNSADQENRFLVIVETSRATSKRTAGIAGTIDTLIRSGMQKQIRPGDTIGFWTYSDTLNAGEFPLQAWSADAGSHISSGALAYLAGQKFGKNAHFSAVLPALMPVVKDSAYLTVIVVCSGTDPIRGTPFDDRIEKAVRSWRDDQQKASMPFVVVLRAAHGQFTHFAVTPAPWNIEMPPFPQELIQTADKTNETTVPPVSKPIVVAQSPAVPPLIISGKHRDVVSRPVLTTVPVTNTNSLAALIPSLPESHLSTNASDNSQAATTQAAALNQSEGLAVGAAVESNRSGQIQRSLVQTRTQRETNGAKGTSAQATAAPRINPSPAVAMPGGHETSIFFRRLMLLVAVLGALVGVVLVRRSRPGHVSLITHAIDRERE